MKICRVFSTFQIDILYSEHYVAKELSELGHHTTVITSDRYPVSWKKYLRNADPAGYYVYDDYDVYRLKAFFPLEKVIFRNWVQLYKHIFQAKYDVIHILGIGTFTTYVVLFMAIFDKRRTKIIINDHTDRRTHARAGFFAEIYYALFRVLYMCLGGRVEKIITFNNEGISILSKRFGVERRKFQIIPLGYDSDKYFHNPVLKNKEEKFIIGFAGKISAKKRVEALVKAVGKSIHRGKIKVIIVGINDQNEKIAVELKKIAEHYNVDMKIQPFLKSKKLAEFYNYIDLAVYPDGVSITTIEASGCGTPIVIHRSIEDLEHRIANGRGKIFATEEELISHIEYYYDRYREGTIDNVRISEVAKRDSSWRNIKNEYLRVYEQ